MNDRRKNGGIKGSPVWKQRDFSKPMSASRVPNFWYFLYGVLTFGAVVAAVFLALVFVGLAVGIGLNFAGL